VHREDNIGRSFVYMLNKVGDKTLPWGKSFFWLLHLLFFPPSVTRYRLFGVPFLLSWLVYSLRIIFVVLVVMIDCMVCHKQVNKSNTNNFFFFKPSQGAYKWKWLGSSLIQQLEFLCWSWGLSTMICIPWTFGLLLLAARWVSCMQRIWHAVVLHRSDRSSFLGSDNPSMLIEIVFSILAFGPERGLLCCLCMMLVVWGCRNSGVHL